MRFTIALSAATYQAALVGQSDFQHTEIIKRGRGTSYVYELDADDARALERHLRHRADQLDAGTARHVLDNADRVRRELRGQPL